MRASHPVSGSGHSAIASPPETNSSASTVASTIFVTISSTSTTTATTDAITPIPSDPKLVTSAAPSSLVIPSRIPGASSSA